MESATSSIQPQGIDPTGKGPVPLSENFLSQIRRRLGSKLIAALSVTAAVSTTLVGVSAWNTWNVYQNYKTEVTKNFRLERLNGDIVHLDEVLTMSARMAASTGDLKWQERYESFVPGLDAAIKEALRLAPNQQVNTSQTDTANIKLVEMEERSFSLVRQKKAAEALKLLLSSEYNQQKQLYSQGMQGTIANIRKAEEAQLKEYGQRLAQSTLFTGASFPVLAISWIVVLLLVRSYIQERNLAQVSVEKLNEDLENRVKQIAEQQQAIQQESEILQADVNQILDSVSAVEAGDLTTQVPVNDRVTGLVADTLNRLTEELAKVLAQVLSAASEVSQGVHNLESAAQVVAANADQQAQSVSRVLLLTEQVEQSAQESSQQIQTSNASLLTVRTAVEQGQEVIAALTQGINVLQQGNTQIVQQMKTLGEFVGLTDQFVQEQRQIASLTQVLAMNASLVAARACEQRDPTQFVVVAREFEAIANQVSSLAQRTNEGLVILEQRSTQIHSVVSAVDANVQNLGGLVEEFTSGVKQSSQVFSNVGTVTGEAVQAGEVVAQSSQQIVSAAQSTAYVMREIADLATKTVQLTQRTRKQSERMENLSKELLQNIQFFQLPQATIQQFVVPSPRVDLSQAEENTLEMKSPEASAV